MSYSAVHGAGVADASAEMDAVSAAAQTVMSETIHYTIQETIMARKYVDCRETPSIMNCSVSIAADTEKELIEAAVQHAMSVHGHEDSKELRENILKGMKEE
jgi:predicted small metal-binding protein